MSNITIKVCAKCGTHLVRRENVMTTSYPAQYIYECPECGNVEYDIKCYDGNLTTEDSVDYKDMHEAALQTARKWIADGCTDKEKIAIEAIFPELRESKDEKIRKLILSKIKASRKYSNFWSDEEVAWVEKQKEQKPVQKSINWTELTWKDIVELEGIINNVHYDFRNGIGQESFGKEVLERFRETKGEEYLDEREQRLMKESEQKPAEPSIDELQRREEEFYNFKVFAAKQAKEHHISFVHDFEWNNFCAELLSYFNETQKPESASASTMIPSCWEEKQEEQKPAKEWSAEDEKMLRDVYESLFAYQCDLRGDENPDPKLLDQVEKEKQWIKSLPKRLNPKPKQEWGEEDEKMIDDVINSLCCYQKTLSDYQKEIVGAEIRKLKSLKPQPKQKWSEEDEKMKERLITRLNWITYNTRTDGTSPNITFFDEIEWLKKKRMEE